MSSRYSVERGASARGQERFERLHSLLCAVSLPKREEPVEHDHQDDMVHVLTGYDTDALGEMELQAFALGNLQLRRAC